MERELEWGGEPPSRAGTGVPWNGRVDGWEDVGNAECMGVFDMALVAAESGNTASQTRDGVETRAVAAGCACNAPY